MTFDELGLDAPLLAAIKEAGYTQPTPIQAAAIPEALRGRDVLGIAQTGTGKTASFVLPIIHRLATGRARARMPRSLILAPTRELAAQVSENFEKYGKNHKLTMALLIGGVSFADQDMKLTRGVDVLIATPGRLLDHHERGKLLLTGLEVMVVDEADRMLDMGFIPDIERIFKLTPFTRQTLFFSATMPPEIQRLTNQFLSAPVEIEVAKPATTADTITQRIVRVPSNDDRTKRAALRELINTVEGLQNGIIFCNRKKNVDVIAKSLQKHGFDARPIHGDLAQSFRTETLQKFRDGDLKLLVASDVAARGLDIPAVSHVFNYSVPINADDYVHRIGRTGRAGRKGHAVMLVTPEDSKALAAVLKVTGIDAIEETDLGAFFESLGDMEERPKRTRRRNEPKSERSEGRTERSEPKTVRSETKVERTERSPQAEQRSRAKPSRSRDRDSEPEAVKGFGDHTPAFLLHEAG
jgi:superfamily II DNA/RNA helicase